MSNYNKVFVVVKGQCEKQKMLAEISCFHTIAREANVPLTSLFQYLDHLHEIGLIKYSFEEKYLYITPLGKAHNTFQEEVNV